LYTVTGAAKDLTAFIWSVKRCRRYVTDAA
jgi:hypothetical protein